MYRSYIFALNFCFLSFFFGCLGVRPFLFLLWGAWVLGNSMVEMAVSVLLCGKRPPVMNLAEPPFKRISRLYRPQIGFCKRGVHTVPQPTGPCGIHPCGRRDVCVIPATQQKVDAGRKRQKKEETHGDVGRRAVLGRAAAGHARSAPGSTGTQQDAGRKRQKNEDAHDGEQFYFERQEQRLCGKHAVNNAIGGPVFAEADLRDGAQMAATEQGGLLKDHAGLRGDFSESAIAHTLLQTSPYRLNATRRVESAASAFVPDDAQDEIVGLLVHKSDHWVAIKQDRSTRRTVAWLLDSCDGGPRPLTAAGLGRQLARHPSTYQVYTEKG